MLTWLALVLLVGFLCWVARLSSILASNDERQQQEAEAKGLALLLENLDPRQREQYDRFGYFDRGWVRNRQTLPHLSRCLAQR